jgi:hypothetical protein
MPEYPTRQGSLGLLNADLGKTKGTPEPVKIEPIAKTETPKETPPSDEEPLIMTGRGASPDELTAMKIQLTPSKPSMTVSEPEDLKAARSQAMKYFERYFSDAKPTNQDVLMSLGEVMGKYADSLGSATPQMAQMFRDIATSPDYGAITAQNYLQIVDGMSRQARAERLNEVDTMRAATIDMVGGLLAEGQAAIEAGIPGDQVIQYTQTNIDKMLNAFPDGDPYSGIIRMRANSGLRMLSMFQMGKAQTLMDDEAMQQSMQATNANLAKGIVAAQRKTQAWAHATAAINETYGSIGDLSAVLNSSFDADMNRALVLKGLLENAGLVTGDKISSVLFSKERDKSAAIRAMIKGEGLPVDQMLGEAQALQEHLQYLGYLGERSGGKEGIPMKEANTLIAMLSPILTDPAINSSTYTAGSELLWVASLTGNKEMADLAGQLMAPGGFADQTKMNLLLPAATKMAKEIERQMAGMSAEERMAMWMLVNKNMGVHRSMVAAQAENPYQFSGTPKEGQ